MHPAAQRAISVRPMLFVAALSLALVACTSSPSSSAQSSTGSGGNTVTLSGLAFSPTSLIVKAGTTVTFKNNDSVDHTVTNGKDGKPDANAAFDKSLPQGQSVDITFGTAGTFNVTCKIHSSMNMTVTVQ
jgi:manganese oxidase